MSIKDPSVKDIPETHRHLPLASGALTCFSPTVCEKILNLMGEGKATALTVYNLVTAHGYQISSRHVARLLASERKARGPITQEIARERLAPSINSDLNALDSVLTDLMALSAEYKEHKRDHAMFLKIVDRIKTVVDCRLHYSGADAKTSDPDVDEAAVRVADKIANLLGAIDDSGSERLEPGGASVDASGEREEADPSGLQ